MRWLAAAAVVAGLAVAPAALAENLPSGSIGVALGGRSGVGAATDAYRIGMILGVKAAWQPMTTDRRVGWGITWSLLRDWFNYGDAANVNGDLSTLEMSLGLNVRLAPQRGGARFLVLGGGGVMLRSNVPLPPDDKRLYAGPYTSIGIDQYVLDRELLLSVEARALWPPGPGLLSFFFGAAVGI